MPFIPAPLLTVGLILIGAGLLRAATVPKTAAIILMLGGVLVVPSGAGGPLTLVLLVPMCLSITAMGAILSRRTHTPAEAALESATVSV